MARMQRRPQRALRAFTEHSQTPSRLGRNFGRLNSWKNPLATVVDFVPLGALSGPGAPDPDLARFRIKV